MPDDDDPVPEPVQEEFSEWLSQYVLAWESELRDHLSGAPDDEE